MLCYQCSGLFLESSLLLWSEGEVTYEGRHERSKFWMIADGLIIEFDFLRRARLDEEFTRNIAQYTLTFKISQISMVRGFVYLLSSSGLLVIDELSYLWQ